MSRDINKCVHERIFPMSLIKTALIILYHETFFISFRKRHEALMNVLNNISRLTESHFVQKRERDHQNRINIIRQHQTILLMFTHLA